MICKIVSMARHRTRTEELADLSLMRANIGLYLGQILSHKFFTVSPIKSWPKVCPNLKEDINIAHTKHHSL